MKYLYFLLLLFISSTSYSQDSIVSKSSYNIFNPTPKKQMRDFSPARPGYTEGVYTIDAGHFQFESDLFKSEVNNTGGVKTITNTYNAASYRLGITNSLDLQFDFNTYATTVTRVEDMIQKESAFGKSLAVRVRKNLWGNDVGNTAFSIVPFINIPLKASDKFSGGIIFPLAISLSDGWSMTTQVRTDLVYNESSNKHKIELSVSATTSHSITENLAFFIEGVALNNSGRTYEYFADGGLILSLSKNINLDAGVNYGIKNISSKTYFTGASFRL